MIGYKLFSLRRDGTIGSLYFNKKQKLRKNIWLRSRGFKQKGFSYRPGWHVLAKPDAPHLKKDGRIWGKVEIENYYEIKRPESHGGKWFLAKRMKILELIEDHGV